jgi:acyl-CoA synthetase (AMP-forming)/AMP-acid ligase II/acyl carrier protein
MPLFHIHGLIGALLSSVAAGATTVCAQGFVAPEFMGWLRDLKPTWYTAVPTIHQKVLEMAKSDPGKYDSLRFIRSASSALPVPVMRSLEERFGVPVIEAYGMTEASHQISVNPLPPLSRKPGSVGLPWGTKVAILDGAGNMLTAGEAGEVAIRGPGVTAGYENNPDANAAAFHDGWLRTGDTGYIDMNGYLHLLGRLKEIINRGGEKVSPFEVEEALLAYPGVKEAAVFPVPGGPMGEEVGAAVVAGDSITVEAIKDFLIPRLAYFKVPSRIVIVESLPKGPTGKVQRIGMDGLLGVPAERVAHQASVKAAPMTRTEVELARIWSEVLRRGDVRALDNFLELGGDSLLATQVMSRIRKSFDVEIPIVSIIESGSLSELGRAIDRLKGEPSNG